MSEQPDEPSTDAQRQGDSAPQEPLPDVPPVAGGTDDTPPAQGEGEHDSW